MFSAEDLIAEELLDETQDYPRGAELFAKVVNASKFD